MTERFLRRDEVSRITGLPVSTIYQQMADGTFPKNFRISPRLCAWRETEIEKWQAKCLAAPPPAPQRRGQRATKGNGKSSPGDP
jgi:prophage regulatory protein